MSIFKSTFKQYVKDQLRTRENARNESGRTQSKNIQYLNSRTGWIRLTSSVDIDPDSELAAKLGLKNNALAKKYILQGGVLYEKNNKFALRRGLGSGGGSYGDKLLGGPNSNWKQGGRQELGIRPMPGITSISVKSKTAYGSLREGIINLTCWSVSQLEELELLYMRPGYAVLLEWGSSLYLDNNSSLVTNSPYINILDVTNTNLSKNKIYESIFQKQKETSGNYDAMFGLIQNFSWSSRQDGGYDCIITIISIGEVMESLKINYVSTNNGLVLDNISKLTGNKEDILRELKANKLKGTLLYIHQKLLETNNTIGIYNIHNNSSNKDISTEYLNIKINESTTSNNSGTNSTDNQIYIPLKFLLELLNNDIILYDNKHKEPYIKLSVNDNDNKPLECFAFYKQVSINPKVCLITPFSDTLQNSTFQPIGPDFLGNVGNDFKYFNKESSKEGNRGIIGNIFLNISNLIEILDSISFQEEKGVVSIYLFLKEVMFQVQKSLGNINNFELHVDGTRDIVRIIDVKYLDEKEIASDDVYTLKVFGNETTVRNYSIQSAIFPSMTTMIAISAQTVGGVLGYDNGNFIKFNEGLINRIIPEVNEYNSTNQFVGFGRNPSFLIDENKQSTIDAFNNNTSLIVQFFETLNKFRKIPSEDKINSLQTALHDIIYYEINNEKDSKANYKGIMPIKLNITLDGLSGLVIGEIFKIPEDRLPLGYKSTGKFRVGFIITGISQEVQNNDWVTTLETQQCMLKSS